MLATQYVQGLRSEIQMKGANHYLMTLIQSKTVQFFYFSESFWKIDGCKWGFLKSTGAIAPVALALTEPLYKACLR